MWYDKQKSLNEETIIYLMGVKLNNYKEFTSLEEKERIIQLGKKWIEEHQGEPINFY